MSRLKSIQKLPDTSTDEDRYSKFDQINGQHPLKKSAPDSVICYKARQRHGGKVSAFNFELAREIGLIPKDHPNKLTKRLSKKVLDTFSLVIINEYDELSNKKFNEKDIKPNSYMATRYLQLQHPNKQGKTSGDGRSIWNGTIKKNGKTYDISSCGTGATCLSPATHIYNKFFKTGDPSISYGCGYSEVDEGLATFFFSEIFNKNKVNTERLLGIIEFQKGLAINIRVHENLIRPSHMLSHLRQSNVEALGDIVEYFIHREEKNKRWKEVPSSRKKRLDYFLKRESEIFAKMAAKFESDYIFCWLDWDGDNILMDGSIIDYGSIRQFGMFHHEYRFDDVTRFSTTIKEQKSKAKYTIQCFIQMIDYLKTGEKKSVQSFSKDTILSYFDKVFEQEVYDLFVQKLGFSKDVCQYLIKSKLNLVKELYSPFSYFERVKSLEGKQKVEDGINWSAVFCMRDILRELPQLILVKDGPISPEEFIEIGKSSYAMPEDLAIYPSRLTKINQFQGAYVKILNEVAVYKKKPLSKILLETTMRSSVINKYDRVTGDSITSIVDKVMKQRPKLNTEDVFNLMHEICNYQTFDPDLVDYKKRDHKHSKLMNGILKIVKEYREGL
ncbi:MAG: hypothetical protein HN576_05310 [Bacteriovoracaceae bacterium]|jgi:uncharacterized protein YdiU (UPF0061 family)|nr:hypothetical protein [Bacteriovoracaceae bacterium]